MTISTVLYSSRSEERPTPQAFFNELNDEFRFTLDPCATRRNTKRHRCKGGLIVLLVQARTNTLSFHDWVYVKAAEIRFARGRLKFGDGKQSAPFPSLVAVFRPAKAFGRHRGSA